MSRRTYHRVERCDEPGCKETHHYEYGLRDDYLEAVRRESNRKHWCQKHDPAAGNIKPSETERNIRTEYVAKKAEDYPNLTTLFWGMDGGKAGSGFAHGQGWNAFADDFPEGTRLIVETKITVLSPDAWGFTAQELASGRIAEQGDKTE